MPVYQCTFLRLSLFFSQLVVIQSTQFLVAVGVYKIHVFDEVFFLLTIRMALVTKLVMVVISR